MSESEANATESQLLEQYPFFDLATQAKPFKNPGFRPRKPKALRQLLATERTLDRPVNEPNYERIAAPPSIKPRKKYCDITGLEAKYTEPKTNLRYHSAQVYELIQELPPHRVQELLALRKANIVLK
ncbi:hypothetical protein BDF22DRAFT_14829 [Syncephalis plumigaleata]|nr:hypothetical protein BDF22DRAFT_14829 [Syncephalis plumigaleata]